MLDRRQMLAATIGTSAVVLLSTAPAVISGEDSAAWRALGEAVAKSLGHDPSARLLAAERGRITAMSDAARQSADDYRAGRTLQVGGVTISRTEAALGLLARERAGVPA